MGDEKKQVVRWTLRGQTEVTEDGPLLTVLTQLKALEAEAQKLDPAAKIDAVTSRTRMAL